MSCITVFKNVADMAYRIHGKGLFCVTPETNADTLPLRAAYLQMNSWACGASAAATLFCYFKPELDPNGIYDQINPSAENGTPEEVIVRGASRHNINMIQMDPCSGLDGIRYHLNKGRPVLAVWEAYDEDCEHYIVIYGERNGGLYVTNIGGNWIGKFNVPYSKFTGYGGYAIFAVEGKG
ncbi:MAG: cysteine peptidase family C39 domain-containing protein [Victivallales bacterium]